MALINIKEFTSAGFDQAQIALLDSNGFPAGIAGSVSNGSTAYMQRFAGAKTAEVQIPETAVVSVTGDDGVLSTFQFQSNEPRRFEMTVGEMQFAVQSAIQGSSIYQVGTYYDMAAFDVKDPSFFDAVLLLTSQARSVVSGSKGAGYYHMLLPLAQLMYRGSNRTEQEAMTHTYSVIMNQADKLPWGTPVNSDSFGKDAASGFLWFSQNRVTLNTYRYNGSDTTYLLDRVPFTDANGKIHVATWYNRAAGVEGLDVTLQTSIVAATKTLTFSSVTPKAAADYLISLVEYE